MKHHRIQKTYQQINQKISEGRVVVGTAEEIFTQIVDYGQDYPHGK